MKFSELKYERPDMKAECEYIENLTKKFADAKTVEEEIAIIADYRDEGDKLGRMMQICYIRNCADTNDKFYADEQAFFDSVSPTYGNVCIKFGNEILKSKHLDEIKKEYGELFVTGLEISSKTMNEEIIPLMEEENKLVSEYQLFNANAKVKFRGQELTISAVSKYITDDDRATRKEAMQALSDFYRGNKDFLETTYDKLVKNRTAQAKKMGYDSFTPLGYLRMNRNSYNAEDVAVFRKQIAEEVVPLAVKAKENQAKRLGLKKIAIYDDVYKFPDGNPKACEDSAEMMKRMRQAFYDISPRFKDYIDCVMDNESYDAPDRPGKRTGAYCATIPGYEPPFAFLNYNGTDDAVNEAFHELGHGFESYTMIHDKNASLNPFTGDIAETHSMAMEYFARRGLKNFFSDEDIKKYETAQVEHALTFLCYGTMVDHFQHIMYDNPDLTPDERNAEWAKLEKIYRPYLDFDGIEFYAAGCVWQRQQHIYSIPFYYIDYVLALTIALQFWQLSEKDFEHALDVYVAYVKKGGYLRFTDLVRSVGLKVPFDEGSLKQLANDIYKTL